MKKIFVAIFMSVIFVLGIKAQSVYYMYAQGSGGGEYIDNLYNDSFSWGIRFSAGSKTRGFVDSSGRWGFMSPAASTSIGYFDGIINSISNLTLGVEGWVCTEGLSVRALKDNTNTNTLDLLTTGTKSTITSNGDSLGLHISSSVGKKIYLYDNIYFDNKHWTSIGPGRNDDPTINNANAKMFRIGSNGGVGIWGTTGVKVNDDPGFYISGSQVSCALPVVVKNGDNRFQIGVAKTSNDSWVGTLTEQGVYLGANNGAVMYLGTDRNLYVGLKKTEIETIRQELKNKYRMFVTKGVLAEDFGISPQSSWADFVFNKNYNLLKISELATFIEKNKHLPDVPSAKTVAEEGYSQHEMNKVLLQKIEELTLYTIRQQQEIDALKAQLQETK